MINKIKNNIIFVICILLSSQLYGKLMMAPVIKLNYNQGVADIAKTEAKAAGETQGFQYYNAVGSSLGLLSKYDMHTIMLFYQLNYKGPGIKSTDLRRLQESTIDHFMMGKYKLSLPNKIILSLNYNYLKEFYRANPVDIEVGKGAYDFSRNSITLGLSKIIKNRYKVGIRGSFNTMIFPNILPPTGQSGERDAEIEAGKQDQNQIVLKLNTDIKFTHAQIKLLGQYQINKYLNKPITDIYGVTDFTTMQNENNIKFNESLVLAYPIKNKKKVVYTPMLQLDFGQTIKRSNNNYPFDINPSDDTPAQTIIASYFDYNSIDIGARFSLSFKNGFAIGTNIKYEYKLYPSRPPQQLDRELAEGTNMYQTSLSVTGYLNFKLNRIFYLHPYLTYTVNTSNNMYEQYVAYNYKVLSGGIAFDFHY